MTIRLLVFSESKLEEMEVRLEEGRVQQLKAYCQFVFVSALLQCNLRVLEVLEVWI